MTGQRTPTRLVPAALFLSVALMACNRQGTPLTGSVNALVLGEVQSPYLDAMKPNLNLVQYTGTQKLDDYDMVVFDGDAHQPQALRDNALVEQALRSGKWVLGLDVNEDHKRTGFGDRLGAVNQGTSPGWMVRVGSDANGRTETWIVNAPQVQAPLTATPGGVLGDAAARLNASTNAYASTVMSKVRGLRAPLPNVGGDPVPSNLIMATYHVSSSSIVPFTKTYKTTGDQTASAQYDYTFKVFLNNSGNPRGDFQWVSVRADVTTNPTNGTGTFSNMTQIEKAWFLDEQAVWMQPSDADTARGLLTGFGSSPATENGQTDVTTGTTFTVGLDASGPSASYTYLDTQIHSIRGWKLDNLSTHHIFAWNYRSSTPIDADGRPYLWPSAAAFDSYSSDNGLGETGLPKEPNYISKTQLRLTTAGVWKTTSLLDQTVNFDLWGSMGLVDLFCPGDINVLGNCGPVTNVGQPGSIVHEEETDESLAIDMGSVVPVPISNITLDSGSTVHEGVIGTAGTITLSKPAKINTFIPVTSNSQNATVLDTAMIPKGQTSGTFQVKINRNGLAPGQSTTATLQAHYGAGFQTQLTIKN